MQLPAEPIRVNKLLVVLSCVWLSLATAVYGELVALGAASPASQVPLNVVEALSQVSNSLDPSVVESYADSAEGRPHAVALRLRAGQELYEAGNYSRALEILERAWGDALAAKPEGWLQQKLVAQTGAAVGRLYARLGHMEKLESLLEAMNGRPIEGAETLEFVNLRQGLHSMKEFPEHSFKCGPLALGNLYVAAKGEKSPPAEIAEAASPREGFSLAALEQLGGQIGFPVLAVKIDPDNGGIPVPSVVHWKAGHYAAITEEKNGNYQVVDPTFMRSFWMSPQAMKAEVSGYYLVPGTAPPVGAQPVAAEQKQSVRGKGAPSQQDNEDQGPAGDDETTCGGMPVASYNAFYAALRIQDVPLFYTPPYGPSVEARLTFFDASTYDHATGTHGYPGRKWMLNWLSYVDVVEANDSGIKVLLFRGSGQSESFTGTVEPFGEGYQITFPQLGVLTESRMEANGSSDAPATLVSVLSAGFTRTMPDGSVEVFGAVGGSGATEGNRYYLAEKRDPQGNSVRYRYAAGTTKLKKVIDALGRETTLYYSDAAGGVGADNSSRRLISAIQDPFGRVARLEYDGEARLIAITDMGGLRSTFAYADSSFTDFVTSMTTPYGTSSFDKSGPSGQTWITLTDPEGFQRKAVFGFSYNGLPLAGTSGALAVPGETPNTPGIEVANGQVWFGYLYYGVTLEWDKKTMRHFPPGEDGKNYDKARQTRWCQKTSSYSVLTAIPSSTREPMAHRVWYRYAGQPNAGSIGTSAQPTLAIRRITNESGAPTDEIRRLEYNDAGNPTKTIDPLGREIVLAYAANGIDLLSVRRKRGSAYETLASYSGYGHDAPRLPRYATDAAGQTTEFRWNSRGQLLETIDPLGRKTVNIYNTQGYLTGIERTDPANASALVRIATIRYDSKGRADKVTGSDGYNIELLHDDLDRVTRVTYPDGTTERMTYTALSLSQVVDRLVRSTSYTHNKLGQIVSSTDAAGRVHRFEWCSCGALKAIIDPMGRKTLWRYDIMGRPVEKEYADGSADRSVYDPASGRLAKTIDAKGQAKTFSYYVDGRTAAIRYNDPKTPDVTFSYDAADGNLVSMSDGTGTTSFTYRSVVAGTLGAGQLASVDGPLSNDTITYTYDELGRRKGYAVNGIGETVDFDALGRVVKAVNALGTFNYNYIGATGRMQKADYPNGMSANFAYDALTGDFRLNDLHYKLTDNSTVARFGYVYNAVGNITQWTQRLPAGSIARRWDITYDTVDQLIAIASRNPDTGAPLSMGSYAYTYDKAGNRLTETVDGVTTTASYNALNQLVSMTGGNSASLPSLAYEWDANDRLLAIAYPGTDRRSEFGYDGFGRRATVTEKTGSTVDAQNKFVWNGLAMLEQRDSAGSTVQKRYFGPGMQTLDGGQLVSRLFIRDHLGSVRSVLSGATAAATVDYSPWGLRSVTGADPSALAFTGHWLHQSSGLAVAPYRSYAPWQGRWVSRDPIREDGGFNLYLYADNNTVSLIDPTGLEPIEIEYKGKRFRAYRFAGDLSTLAGNVYGKGNLRGECAAGVQELTGAPRTSTWLANTPTLLELLASGVEIPSGTVFASMGGPGGKYGNKAGNQKGFDHTIMFEKGEWKTVDSSPLARLFGGKPSKTLTATYGNQHIRTYSASGKIPEPFYFRTQDAGDLRGGSQQSPYRLVSDSYQ